MRKHQASASPTCGVDYAFKRIGGNNKARIISHLQHGPVRSKELHRHLPDITHATLVRALRELEVDQLVIRTVDTEANLHVEYALTPSCQELLPAITLLKQWAEKDMRKQD